MIKCWLVSSVMTSLSSLPTFSLQQAPVVFNSCVAGPNSTHETFLISHSMLRGMSSAETLHGTTAVSNTEALSEEDTEALSVSLLLRNKWKQEVFFSFTLTNQLLWGVHQLWISHMSRNQRKNHMTSRNCWRIVGGEKKWYRWAIQSYAGHLCIPRRPRGQPVPLPYGSTRICASQWCRTSVETQCLTGAGFPTCQVPLLAAATCFKAYLQCSLRT